MKMRIFWLDNLKAIGVFAILFAHMIPEHDPFPHLRQYIYSFDIQLFLFVSGYTFDRNKYHFGQFFQKKFRTIMVPYLFFATFSFLFWFFVVRNLSISGEALAIDPLKPFIGILYGIGIGDWRTPMNIALWFLPFFFVVEMGFYFVRNKYFLLVFAIIGYLVTYLPVRLPWGSDIAITGIVFYGFGNIMKDVKINYLALPVLCGLHIVFCFLNGYTDMNLLAYGNPIFFYVSAFSGVLFYVGIGKLIGENAVMNYVGRNTIILIGFSGITLFIMNGISYMVFGTKLKPSGPEFAFLVTILQIALTVPAIYCINKWLPFILGKPALKTMESKDAL